MNAHELQAAVDTLWPHLVAVALIACRLAPVTFLCPLFGGSAAPSTVRLGVALALSLFTHLAGGVGPVGPPGNSWELGAQAGREIVFGVALGLLASLPFDAARIGGRFVDLFRGSSAEASLPQAGSREAASGDLLYQLLLALVASGAVLPLVLPALLKSYALVGVGLPMPTEGMVTHVLAALGGAFSLALALGAPVAGACLAVDLGLGLAARTVPSLSLNDTGTPLRILGGGVILWFSIGILAQRLLGAVAGSAAALQALAEAAQ